jgi:hypothetical protein
LFDLSRSHRRCGNVETRVLCGFPSSEGTSRTVSVDRPSSRPRAPFPQRGPSLSAILARMCRLGGRRSGNRCISETHVECTFLQILAQSRFFKAGGERSAPSKKTWFWKQTASSVRSTVTSGWPLPHSEPQAPKCLPTSQSRVRRHQEMAVVRPARLVGSNSETVSMLAINLILRFIGFIDLPLRLAYDSRLVGGSP